MSSSTGFVKLHIPNVDELYGPVPAGSLVTLMGPPQAGLHAVAAMLVKEALTREDNVALLTYLGFMSDYLYLLEVMGIMPSTYIGRKFILDSVDDPAVGLKKAVEYVGQLYDAIILDYRGVGELGAETIYEYLERIRGSETVTYMLLDETVMSRQMLSWVSKLSELVLEFRVEETPVGYERSIKLYSSKRLSRDFRIGYRLTERGVAFESVTRL